MKENGYGKFLSILSFFCAVFWALFLLVEACRLYLPYGMMLSVTAAQRFRILSFVKLPTLLIAAAFLLVNAEKKNRRKSALLLASLAAAIPLASVIAGESVDPSPASYLTSAVIFVFVPLFLACLPKSRQWGKLPYLTVLILWILLLTVSAVMAFLPHVLFQTFWFLYLILPFSVLSALLLLPQNTGDDLRALVILSDLILPAFVSLRVFFQVDAITLPRVLFPSVLLLLITSFLSDRLRRPRSYDTPTDPKT